MALVSDHAESDSAASDTLLSRVIRGRAARRRNCTSVIFFLIIYLLRFLAGVVNAAVINYYFTA